MARKKTQGKQVHPAARFSVGTRVRVKPGTPDPDFPDIPLGGWAGKILKVSRKSVPPSYLIGWNEHTSDQVDKAYSDRWEWDSPETWLGEDDLEPDGGGTCHDRAAGRASRPRRDGSHTGPAVGRLAALRLGRGHVSGPPRGV